MFNCVHLLAAVCVCRLFDAEEVLYSVFLQILPLKTAVVVKN